VPVDREGAYRVYEFLSKLQPDEGVTLDELVTVADSSEMYVHQILTRVRRGAIAEPNTRKGMWLPPLNVNFDRQTGLYYNLGAAGTAKQVQGPDILRTWAEDSGSRLGSLCRSLSSFLDGIEAMEDKEAARELLGQLPSEAIGNVTTAAYGIGDQMDRATKIRRRLARAH